MDPASDSRSAPDATFADGLINVVSSSALGVCLVDRDLRLLWVSDAFADLLRVDSAALVGRSVLDITHPGDTALSMELTDAVFDRRIPYFRTHKRYVRHDGSEFAGDLLVSVGFDGEDDVAVAILNDAQYADPLTLRVEQLQRAATLGEIGAGIAHDVRGALRLVVEASSQLAVNPERSDELLPAIVSAADTAETFVASLVELAGPAADHISSLLLETLLADVVPILHMVVPAQTRLLVTSDAPHVCVEIERVEFRQVMLNLVMNARDSISGMGGIIEIHAAIADHDADLVEIIVGDNGSGMSPEIIDSVFDAYFTTKGEDGTGLGLPLSREIVRRTGGDISVVSTPHEGSQFTVRLRCRPG